MFFCTCLILIKMSFAHHFQSGHVTVAPFAGLKPTRKRRPEEVPRHESQPVTGPGAGSKRFISEPAWAAPSGPAAPGGGASTAGQPGTARPCPRARRRPPTPSSAGPSDGNPDFDNELGCRGCSGLLRRPYPAGPLASVSASRPGSHGGPGPGPARAGPPRAPAGRGNRS